MYRALLRISEMDILFLCVCAGDLLENTSVDGGESGKGPEWL